jgi:hypothetical protein
MKGGGKDGKGAGRKGTGFGFCFRCGGALEIAIDGLPIGHEECQQAAFGGGKGGGGKGEGKGTAALQIVLGQHLSVELARVRNALAAAEHQANADAIAAEAATHILREVRMLMRTGAGMNVQVYNLIVDAENALGYDESETDEADEEEADENEETDEDDDPDLSCVLCGRVGGDGMFYNMAPQGNFVHGRRIVCHDCHVDDPRGAGEVESFF